MIGFFNKFLLFGSFIFLVFACNAPSSEEPVLEVQDTPNVHPEERTDDERTLVLFFGNSLTAAYGLDPSEGFTGLIQEKVDSLGWPVEVVNAGVTGETTASGNTRAEWVLKRQDVDVFVLELGANDGLRGIPTEETEKNLKSIIGKVRKHHPDADIILAGMMVPPNMGEDYSQRFQQIFPRVAEKENVHLIPFLLKGVAGEEDLNLEDGIHPNPEGHRIVAETVWESLQPVLKDELN